MSPVVSERLRVIVFFTFATACLLSAGLVAGRAKNQKNERWEQRGVEIATTLDSRYEEHIEYVRMAERRLILFGVASAPREELLVVDGQRWEECAVNDAIQISCDGAAPRLTPVSNS